MGVSVQTTRAGNRFCRPLYNDTMSGIDELHVKDLLCQRNGTVLFHSINRHLQGGEWLLVTGHNGAGKTSLLRTMVGLTSPTEGDVVWKQSGQSMSPQAYQPHLLYLGHQSALHPQLTALENLTFYCCLRGSLTRSQAQQNSRSALEYFQVERHADTACFQLSAGQMQRVLLSRLISEPVTSWILDEPAASLDQAGLQLLESLMTEHLQAHRLAVVSSHQRINPSGVTMRALDLSARAVS